MQVVRRDPALLGGTHLEAGRSGRHKRLFCKTNPRVLAVGFTAVFDGADLEGAGGLFGEEDMVIADAQP